MEISKFSNTNVGKTIKTALYLALSSLVGSLIAAIGNDANLFGPATVAVNLILVFVKQTFFSPDTPNL